MPTYKIQFEDDINVSLDRGDMIYWIPNSEIKEVGGYATSINNNTYIKPRICGIAQDVKLKDFSMETVHSTFVDAISGSGNDNGGFFMFEKDNSIHNSSLVGYYMEVTLENSSQEKAELFSLGSEISISSK